MRTNLKIGEKGYPLDNSWSECISYPENKNRAWLAGNIQEEPKEIEVISKPFRVNFKAYSQMITREFILVSYKGDIYKILNRFRDEIKPE